MAKKGSHPKNGADRSAGNKAGNKLPGFVDRLPSDMNRANPLLNGFRGPGSASEHVGFPGNMKNDTKRRKSSANTKKNGRIGSASVGDKSEVKTQSSGKSSSPSKVTKGVNPSPNLDETNGDFMVSHGQDHTSENPHGIYHDGAGGDQVAEKKPLAKLAIEQLSVLALHLRQIASLWVAKQKPLISSFAAVVFNARNCMQSKVKHAYAVIHPWIIHLGKILFLFSMVWLDCSLRGLGSLLHLGTTSFFAIIWCSCLSLLAMIGITKMLMVVVAACLVAVFIGLRVAILVAVITSAVFLWLYGNFWATIFVIVLSGIAFGLSHERGALFLTTVYSLYCVGGYMGWLGLFMGLNLSFISSDILINILRSNSENQGSDIPPEHANSSQSREHHFYKDSKYPSSTDDAFNSSFERSAEQDAGAPSTSGNSVELTSEDEVMRLLSCTDHYSALGFARYESIDISSLKREYRKKAMLVHPDKNMGNEKAAEAFKKLQNAYEVLLDSLKRKTYDDELRRGEILNYFRRFQNILRKNRRNGVYGHGSYQGNGNDSFDGEARRIACKKCGGFHIWIQTSRPKSRARWCQDCKDFHHTKDGDGWVEQSFQPLMFGLLSKMDPPHAYVCADSKIYDATEWFICQGMRCPVNSHKPSFHINTSLSSMKHNGKGNHSSGGESMTEEELFEWLQNAMQSGVFVAPPGSTPDESPSTKNGSFPKSSSSKKKRKGKKAW